MGAGKFSGLTEDRFIVVNPPTEGTVAKRSNSEKSSSPLVTDSDDLSSSQSQPSSSSAYSEKEITHPSTIPMNFNRVRINN